ncbi:MAG: hypothetical protein ABUJ92_00745 [Desulfobacterales bacterium]
MQAIISARSGLFNIDKANEVAAELNADVDDDWNYLVIDCNNGYGRIDVYDEDEELVFKGFVV